MGSDGRGAAGELRAVREEHRRDVEQLRVDLAGLSTLTGDNADLLRRTLSRVSGLDDELADLAERVDILAGAVSDLAGAGPRPGPENHNIGDRRADQHLSALGARFPDRGRRRPRVAPPTQRRGGRLNRTRPLVCPSALVKENVYR